MGHSIRFKNFRYTEWRDVANGKLVKDGVLTDLVADPGEETNLAKDEEHVETLAYAKERLALRIEESTRSSYNQKEDPVQTQSIRIDASPDNLRQTVDGFGGSIAMWGTHADDQAMEAALKELNITFVRAQGEVNKKGLLTTTKIFSREP